MISHNNRGKAIRSQPVIPLNSFTKMTHSVKSSDVYNQNAKITVVHRVLWNRHRQRARQLWKKSMDFGLWILSYFWCTSSKCSVPNGDFWIVEWDMATDICFESSSLFIILWFNSSVFIYIKQRCTFRAEYSLNYILRIIRFIFHY